MTKSRCVVAIPIAAALKLRTMFHAYCVLGAVCTPTLIYAWVIYRDPFELVKFNLPTDCFLIGMDHQPWWMISPFALLFGGLLLYCLFVGIFYDRNNSSSIVNLVSKNINSEELIEVKI